MLLYNTAKYNYRKWVQRRKKKNNCITYQYWLQQNLLKQKMSDILMWIIQLKRSKDILRTDSEISRSNPGPTKETLNWYIALESLRLSYNNIWAPYVYKFKFQSIYHGHIKHLILDWLKLMSTVPLYFRPVTIIWSNMGYLVFTHMFHSLFQSIHQDKRIYIHQCLKLCLRMYLRSGMADWHKLKVQLQNDIIWCDLCLSITLHSSSSNYIINKYQY